MWPYVNKLHFESWTGYYLAMFYEANHSVLKCNWSSNTKTFINNILHFLSCSTFLYSAYTSSKNICIFHHDPVQNFHIIWRSASAAICSLPNRGVFHQKTPLLPARHIQDALLMQFSFEKNTRLVIVMTSPAVRCRRWLKSLFWLQEFCQWDAHSWRRLLWSFWHPLELTNRPPSHPSTTCPGRGMWVP